MQVLTQKYNTLSEFTAVRAEYFGADNSYMLDLIARNVAVRVQQKRWIDIEIIARGKSERYPLPYRKPRNKRLKVYLGYALFGLLFDDYFLTLCEIEKFFIVNIGGYLIFGSRYVNIFQHGYGSLHGTNIERQRFI